MASAAAKTYIAVNGLLPGNKMNYSSAISTGSTPVRSILLVYYRKAFSARMISCLIRYLLIATIHGLHTADHTHIPLGSFAA